MFGNVYSGKKVLVTGNTGFKGSWLAQWLLQLGAKVYGLSKDVPTQPSLFETLELGKKGDTTFADIRDLERVAQAVATCKPDFVFHLAAQSIVSSSYTDPVTTFSTNVLGTVHLLEALRKSGHNCTAVLITSDKCYDNVEWTWGYRENDRLGGKDPYSGSKGAAELAIKSYYHSYFKPGSPLRLASARAGNVIGGGDWAQNRLVPDCFRAWSQGHAVQIRNPDSTRPWQHVLEPISGYLRLGEILSKKPHINGESYNFGPHAHQNHSALELLQELQKHWNFGAPKEVYSIVKSDTFHEAALLKLNCDKALNELRWEPTLNFADAAKLTSEWYDHFYRSRESIIDCTEMQIRFYVERAHEKRRSWAE